MTIEQLGRANIDYREGIINFFLREPFKGLQLSEGNFFLSQNMIDSIYNENQINVSDNTGIIIRANYTQKVQTYKLRHTHILENSVKVKVNGAEINNNLYKVDYSLGFFYFVNKEEPVITPNSRIDISYEYSPFGETSRGFILGLRSEYEASKSIQLGNTILYNGTFEKSEAPSIGEEPDSRFIIENDLKMNFDEERFTQLINNIPGLNFDLLPIQYKFYGEYTYSLYNPNTFGRALIDDFESSEEQITVSLSDRDWVISSIPPSIGSTECDRAPLHYRYHRDLSNIDLGPTPLFVPAQASPPYQQLAGPYNAAEGHLDASQLEPSEREISLVLDFDFSQGLNRPFVSVVSRNFSNRSEGRDFSSVEYLEFSARLIDSVGLEEGISVNFDIGTINEDSDSDSQLDTEDIGSDGINNDLNGDDFPDTGIQFTGGEKNQRIDFTSGGFNEDVGYEFNAPSSCTNLTTTVGAGPSLPDLPRTIGNGVLNTEDLNLDGRLNTEENTVTIDGAGRDYLTFDESPGLNANNVIRPGDWTLVRVYIDPSQLNESQIQAIRSVRSIRMYVVPNSSSSRNGIGKLLIDNIKFGSSKWRQRRVSISGIESDLTDPEILQVATIDTEDSRGEYLSDSFIRNRNREYEDLHGKKTNTERERIREAALKINYDFSSALCNANCEYAYVRRVFTPSLNLRYYSKLNIWVNYIQLNTPRDSIFIRIGSSDEDYIEFHSEIQGRGWQLLTFDVPEQLNSTECILPAVETNGCPNLKEVNTMAIGVSNQGGLNMRGVIWVNDLFVSDPRIQGDDAYRIHNYMRIIKPLFKTKAGVPVLNNIEISYERKEQGNRFFTLNQTHTNISQKEDNVQLSLSVFPWWETKYIFYNNRTESDPDEIIEQRSLDGRNSQLEHSTLNDFNFDDEELPKIHAKYEFRKFTTDRTSIIDDTGRQNTSTIEKTYLPFFSLDEKFPEFWNQNINYNIKVQTKYFIRNQNINEEADEQIAGSENRENGQNRQNQQNNQEQTDFIQTSLRYTFGSFSLEPSYEFSQIVLVNQDFTDNENIETINGNFYFPFFLPNSDYRYRHRNSHYKLKVGYQGLWIFSPAT